MFIVNISRFLVPYIPSLYKAFNFESCLDALCSSAVRLPVSFNLLCADWCGCSLLPSETGSAHILCGAERRAVSGTPLKRLMAQLLETGALSRTAAVSSGERIVAVKRQRQTRWNLGVVRSIS